MIAAADLGLLDGFERALINGRLHLAYQPKISLVDGSLKRVEALVRWDDPALGPIPPSRFVPLAERHGLIDPLTQWGLRTALTQWRLWHKQGIDICLAFNISALSLEQLDFPDLVERMCRALEVPTERLVLELTEGATQPLIKLMDTLTRFRIKGIGLAIDDFGTGYSTLMQLRQLPFTELKIDRFFLTDMMDSADSRLLVRTMIELAHGLGLTATAEGVETEAQLLLLREMKCDVAQGYLMATPLAPENLADWYRDWRQRWPALILDPAAPPPVQAARRSRSATTQRLRPPRLAS
jgi:EAL domain-containing protein (putative c-di-GMP-specific phosphodiesterase class I)